MVYELWDTDSFNLIDEFETESAAIEAARELIDANRSVYPEALALACGDARETIWLASGRALLDRIQRAQAHASIQTARLPSE